VDARTDKQIITTAIANILFFISKPPFKTFFYILKVVAKDVETLDQKLLELKKQNNITKSHTLFALSPHKQSYTILP
jgi:hypothetical protein